MNKPTVFSKSKSKSKFNSVVLGTLETDNGDQLEMEKSAKS